MKEKWNCKDTSTGFYAKISSLRSLSSWLISNQKLLIRILKMRLSNSMHWFSTQSRIALSQLYKRSLFNHQPLSWIAQLMWMAKFRASQQQLPPNSHTVWHKRLGTCLNSSKLWRLEPFLRRTINNLSMVNLNMVIHSKLSRSSRQRLSFNNSLILLSVSQDILDLLEITTMAVAATTGDQILY